MKHIFKKGIGKFFFVMLTTILMSGGFFGVSTVLASGVITSVVLNSTTFTTGTTQITVSPGSTITTQVNLTITDNSAWKSTGWRISTTSGPYTCVNTSNTSTNGPHTRTLTGVNGVTAPLSPGTYNLYIQAYSTEDCTQPSLAVFPIYNNAVFVPAPNGFLTLIKNTVGGDGTFNFTGNTGITSLTTSAGTDQKNVSLAPGSSYNISETDQDGWALTSAICTNNSTLSAITITSDQTTTCTITNTKKGHIIIDKVTNPEESGQSFSFDANGNNYDDFTLTNSDDLNDQEVAPGEYTVVEESLEGWDLTNLECDAEDTTVELENRKAIINVAAGETVNCTFTNTKHSSITVIKNVVAPDGEIDVEDDTVFQVHLNEGAGQGVSEGNNVYYNNLTPGESYLVAEDQNDNYGDIVYSDDCDISSLEVGQDAVCTITNIQKKGKLTINKEVDNSHVIKDSEASDFSVDIKRGDETVMSGVEFTGNEGNLLVGTTGEIELDPGVYSVVETDTLGYAPQYSSGCQNITITSNSNGAVCNITNHDLEEGKGAITVIKDINNDDGGTAAADDFELKIDKQIGEGCEENCDPESYIPNSGEPTPLNPGTYAVSEMISEELREEYTQAQAGIVCLKDEASVDANNIVLDVGDVVVCTVYNTDIPAHLTIIKNTGNENYNGTFEFTVTGVQQNPSIITSLGTGSVSIDLNKGEYDVQEIVPNGWNFSSVSCIYDGESVGTSITHGEHIIVDNGDTVTCTFTNSPKLGTLTVKKTVINDNGGDKTPSDFSFKVNDGEAMLFNSEGDNTMTVVVGNYTITEVAVENYTASYNNCSEMVINEGEETTCEITNTFTNLIISNEQTSNVESRSVTVTWDTNHPATSRVVYGTTSMSTLGGAPNYGYESSTDEDTNLVTSHSVEIGDLNDGETYYFRPISHGSPEVVGSEVSATTERIGSSGGGGSSGGTIYTITASAVGVGIISPSGSLPVGVSNSQTYIITPGFSFQIADVVVDGSSVGQVSTYTFSNVSSNHTIVAQFAPAGQVAGASTFTFTPPPSIPDQGGDQNNGGGTGSTESGNGTGGNQEEQTQNNQENIDTGDNQENQAQAAVGSSSGANAFWVWVSQNWQFLLIILIAITVTYYIYWLRSKNKT